MNLTEKMLVRRIGKITDLNKDIDRVRAEAKEAMFKALEPYMDDDDLHHIRTGFDKIVQHMVQVRKSARDRMIDQLHEDLNHCDRLEVSIQDGIREQINKLDDLDY